MKNLPAQLRLFSLFLGLVLLLMSPALCFADSAGIQSLTSPTVWPNADNQDWNVGWEFLVIGSVTVDALGYNYLGTPLNTPHQVGIYDYLGNLLASATVDNSSTSSNGYLYTSLGSGLVLAAGDYLIAGTTLGPNDGWIYQTSGVVTDPSVFYVQSWYSPGNGGILSFPTTPASNDYLGVNFAIATPEPGTLLCLVLGLATIGVLTRIVKVA